MVVRRLVGALLTVLGGAALVALVGFVAAENHSPATPQMDYTRGTTSTTQGQVRHAYIHLSTYPDSEQGFHGPDGGPHPDWVTYGPHTDLTVPAHALVTVTIDQYDGGERITNPYFARVHGTVGGTETVEYILERAKATGEEYLPEQVYSVVETQFAYLRAIGAVGPPRRPDPPGT